MYARHKGGIRKDLDESPPYHATQRGVDARRVAQIRMSSPASTSESEGEWVYQSRSQRRKGRGAINHAQRNRNLGGNVNPGTRVKKRQWAKAKPNFRRPKNVETNCAKYIDMGDTLCCYEAATLEKGEEKAQTQRYL